MPNLDVSFGRSYVATTTGTVTVSTQNCQILGVLVAASATGAFQLFHGQATGNPITNLVRAFSTTGSVTAQSAVYFPVPGYASGGLTLYIAPAADPKLTLFYNPLSGGGL